MGLDLNGIKVAVIGGDRRDLYLISELVRKGAHVTIVGYQPSPELVGAKITGDMAEALAEAGAVILPVPGTDPEGGIGTMVKGVNLKLTRELAALISPGTPVIIGVARNFVKAWGAEFGWKLLEIADMDQVAILNAIPSAEGAIQLAMERLPITIHDSNSLVLGFGRLGEILSGMLQGLGAHTTVVARREAARARAFAYGYRPVSFEQLDQVLPEADIVFNTVPAPVLTHSLLARMSTEALVVDLAAAPGGTDFTAAAELGVSALLAPGLPGRIAPKTSGKILARVIPQLILAALSEATRE